MYLRIKPCNFSKCTLVPSLSLVLKIAADPCLNYQGVLAQSLERVNESQPQTLSFLNVEKG
jgi:hypothetical protein